METLEMKKELIYFDSEKAQATLESYKEWISETAFALEQAQALLPRELTNEEKEQLLEGGWPSLQKMIGEAYGLPKAKTSVVLDLQGLDGTAAEMAFMNVPSRHAVVGFVITDNGAEISPETIEKVENRHRHYCKNNRQSEALELARTISDLLNQNFERKVITNDERRNTVKALGLYVQMNSAPRSEQIVEPNLRKISQLTL